MKASLTPIVTLLFLLVFSVFLAVYELSVSHVVTVSGQRYLDGALQTAFSYYNQELWKEYRLLFLPVKERKGENLMMIEDCIRKGTEAAEGGPSLAQMETGIVGGVDWSVGTYRLQSVETLYPVYATDEEYQPVMNQILAWSRYEAGEQLVEQIKEKVGLTKEVSEQEEKAVEEVEEAEEKVVICRQLLQLYTLVEGIVTNDSGIVTGEGGIPKTVRYFAKMLCTGEITASKTGIPRKEIWQALCGSYYDPLRKVKDWRIKLQEAEEAGKTVTIDRGEVNDWRFQLESVESKTAEAIQLAKMLESSATRLSEEEKEFCDVAALRSHLEYNQRILSTVLALSEGRITLAVTRQIQNQFAHYQAHSLMFGYDGFIEEDRISNPFRGIQLGWGNSLMDWFVEDTAQLSKKQIANAGQYEALLQKGTEDNEVEDTLRDTDRVMKQTGKGSTGKVKDVLEDSKGIFGYLEKGIQELVKLGLINYYIQRHFDCFETQQGDAEEDNAIEYEREYLVVGEKSDYENLTGVCSRILLLRMGLNFASILTDSGRKTQALAIATGMVGFTFLQPLVQIVKYAILVGWSLEESFLDVAALMAGRYVPLWKTKDTFSVTVEELAAFNPSSVRKRACNYSEKKTNLQYLCYDDYLELLLCSVRRRVLIARMMDIMENQMRYAFEEHFSFMECLYQIQAQAMYKWKQYQFVRESQFSYQINE